MVYLCYFSKASINSQIFAVDRIIKANADETIKNSQNLTAFDYSISIQNINILTF